MPTPALQRLETERLLLRRGRVDDAEVFHQLWSERDPRVPPYRRIAADGRPTVADLAAELAAEPADRLLNLLTVETRDGRVVGYCGLAPHGSGSAEEPELAYELLRSAQGAGRATEAAAAVVRWAAAAGYPRLWAGVWDWNTASRRVLQKLDFVETDAITATSPYGHSLLTVRELGAEQIGS